MKAAIFFLSGLLGAWAFGNGRLEFGQEWSLRGDRGSLVTAKKLMKRDTLFLFLSNRDVSLFSERLWLADLQKDDFRTLFVFRGDRSALADFRKENHFWDELFIDGGKAFPELRQDIRFYFHGAKRGEHQRGRSWPSGPLAASWFFEPSKDTGQIGQLLGNRGLRMQRHENDCGAAALLMLLDRRGYDVSPDFVYARLDLGPMSAPVSLLQIKQFLAGLDIPGSGWRGTRGDLAKLTGPAILHVDRSHYVVFVKAFSERVLVLDPKLGRTAINQEQLAIRWQGVYFTID